MAFSTCTSRGLAVSPFLAKTSVGYVEFPQHARNSLEFLSNRNTRALLRKLHLIGKGLIHDWNWLLSNNLEAAEPLGNGVFIVGVLLCAASIIVGIIFAVRDYRWFEDKPFPE